MTSLFSWRSGRISRHPASVMVLVSDTNIAKQKRQHLVFASSFKTTQLLSEHIHDMSKTIPKRHPSRRDLLGPSLIGPTGLPQVPWACGSPLGSLGPLGPWVPLGPLGPWSPPLPPLGSLGPTGAPQVPWAHGSPWQPGSLGPMGPPGPLGPMVPPLSTHAVVG